MQFNNSLNSSCISVSNSDSELDRQIENSSAKRRKIESTQNVKNVQNVSQILLEMQKSQQEFQKMICEKIDKIESKQQEMDKKIDEVAKKSTLPISNSSSLSQTRVHGPQALEPMILPRVDSTAVFLPTQTSPVSPPKSISFLAEKSASSNLLSHEEEILEEVRVSSLQTSTFQQGTALFKQGKYKEAAEEWEKAISAFEKAANLLMSPTPIDTLILHGRTLGQLSRYKAALEKIERADMTLEIEKIDFRDKRVFFIHHLGNFYREIVHLQGKDKLIEKQFGEACLDVKKKMQLLKYESLFYFHKTQYTLAITKVKEALKLCKFYKVIEPEIYLELHHCHGKALHKLKKYAEAEQQFAQGVALPITQKQALIFYDYALTLKNLGKYEKALEQLNKGFALTPHETFTQEIAIIRSLTPLPATQENQREKQDEETV